MRVTPVETKAWAHCHHAMCQGYGQEEVAAVKTTVEYTYGDNGADMFKSMVERSTVMVDFENDEDRACRFCGNPREITDQARPSYQNLSTFDPMGLVNGTVGTFNPQVVNTDADAKVAALEAGMARQAAQIEALLAAITDTPGTES